jgi:hypothetical protein
MQAGITHPNPTDYAARLSQWGEAIATHKPRLRELWGRGCGCFTCNPFNSNQNIVETNNQLYAPHAVMSFRGEQGDVVARPPVLQRAVTTRGDDSGTIGSRMRQEREASERAQNPYKTRSGDFSGPVRNNPRIRYREPKQRGIWDEKTRPSYNPGTKDAVLAQTPSQTINNKVQYQCQGGKKCGNKYFPENKLTLDHVQDWKSWIYRKARGNSTKITGRAARDAYSDTRNLVAMCSPCNSEKNGPKHYD